jgi:hypothetical protein
MPPRVMLQDIIEAIDLPNRDWKSYLNRETGAIVTVMDDMAMGPDGEVDPADGSRSQILSQVVNACLVPRWKATGGCRGPCCPCL